MVSSGRSDICIGIDYQGEMSKGYIYVDIFQELTKIQ